MRTGWPVRRLVEICEMFADGDWIEAKDQSLHGVRLIQTGNVGDGVFRDRGQKARYISEATFHRLRCTEIFKGDCLISRLPEPVGRSCIIPDTGERMITAVDCTIARFNPKVLIPEYFNFYSQSSNYLNIVDREATGTTRKRISRSRLGEVLVPLPPLPEQRRLVGVLGEAFAGIAAARVNAEKSLESARALIQATFASLIDSFDHAHWSAVRVGEAARAEKGSIRSGPFGSQLLHSEFVEDGIPVLGIDNAVRNYFAWGERRYITQQKFSELSRYQVRPSDVLITIMGTCGRCAIVPEDIPKAVNSKHLCCITLDPTKCLPEYFHAYFLWHPSVRQFLSSRVKGAIMEGLNIGIIKEVPLLLPPIKQQQAIVRKVAGIRRETKALEDLYQRKLAALVELKKSLLNQAFSGQP